MKKTFLALLFVLLMSLQAYAVQKATIQKNIIKSKTAVSKPQKPTKEMIDKRFYENARIQLGDNKYQVYRVAERIIRANKLDEHSWRISFLIDTENGLNAFAGDANLITIKNGLLDSFNGDIHALAFIISHEIAHNLLEHPKKSQEIRENYNQRIARYKQNVEEVIQNQTYILKLQDEVGAYTRYTVATSTGLVSLAAAIGGKKRMNSLNQEYQDLESQLSNIKSNAEDAKNHYIQLMRNQEFEADEIAISLVTKAGFDISGAIRTFNLLGKLPTVDRYNSEHPETQERIKAIDEKFKILDILSLTNEGKLNIKTSGVLPYDKSLDQQTIVIKARYTSNTDVDKSFDKLFK